MKIQNIIFTKGVMNNEKLKDRISDLWVNVLENYRNQPSISVDGGNDRDFFSFIFIGVRMFACKNELDGLTIMLPDEY